MSEQVIKECCNDPILKCLSCRRVFNIDINKMDLSHFGGEFTETEMLCHMCTSALTVSFQFNKVGLEKMFKNIINEQLFPTQ